MADDPLNWLLLGELIVVVIVISAFLFYWNRLGGRVVAFLIRLYAWRIHHAYVSIGSLQISPLAGRIAFRDVQYSSSNISARALHGHITFRYWHARVRQEGDAQSGNAKRQKLPSRIMVDLEGVEAFVYNRTPAYDAIIERMKKHERAEERARGASQGTGDAQDGGEDKDRDNPITLRLRKVYKAMNGAGQAEEERLETLNSNDSSSAASNKPPIPNALPPVETPIPKPSSVDWFREMLPVDIRVQTGSVVLGSDATPMVLIGDFKRAEGTLEVSESRSLCDKYKFSVDLRFEQPKVLYRTNLEWSGPLLAHGKKVYDRVVQERAEVTKQPPSRMSIRSAFLALAKSLAFIRDPDFSTPPIHGLPADRTWRGLARYRDDAEPAPHREEREYAKVTTLLETPLLELAYFADTPGAVPDRTEVVPDERDEFGNVDLPPEYGIDITVHGGMIKYGPWADRQRDALQRAFAPSIFFDTEPMPRLKKGDTRVHTNLVLTVQIAEETTLRIPTREPSKDWQYDDSPTADRRYGWLDVVVGPHSSVIYTQAQHANKHGYDSMLVLHLDSLGIASSVNLQTFVRAQACKLSVTMPTPLQWNAQREWGLDLTLETPDISLLRDHVTLISDLAKDWSTGVPSDFHHFVPNHYNFRVTMNNYAFHLYINDNNVVDRPQSRDDNAFLDVYGPRLVSYVSVAATQYRPEQSVVPFSIKLDDARVEICVPKWDTHASFLPGSLEIGKIGSCTAEGSYRYYSAPHPEHQETLNLHLDASRVAFKCLGWVLRRLFCVKDNYFGMFTQFRTMGEYLERFDEDPSDVGDPVEAKYRPGRADALSVNVSMDVRDSLILLSDEIYAAQRGLAMPVPQLQMHLKSVEAFMELSLDAPPTFIVPADFGAYEHMDVRVSPTEAVLVEGITLKANRLFGPQPRGETYLCLWEAVMPRITALLTPGFIVALKQSVAAVVYNFADEENAPTKIYIPESKPDVTFFKLSLGSASVFLAHEDAAVAIDIGSVNLDTSSLASLTCTSAVGVIVPRLDATLLARRNASWTPVGSVHTGLGVDVYKAAKDRKGKASRQQAFIRAQDEPTRRIWYMYTEAEGDGELGNHVRNMYLPRPRVFDESDDETEWSDSSSDDQSLDRSGRARRLARSFRTAREEVESVSSEGSQSSYASSESDEGDDEPDMAGLLARKRSWMKGEGLQSQAPASESIGAGGIPRKAGESGTVVRLQVRPVVMTAGVDCVAPAMELMCGLCQATLDTLLDKHVDAVMADAVQKLAFSLDVTVPSIAVALSALGVRSAIDARVVGLGCYLHTPAPSLAGGENRPMSLAARCQSIHARLSQSVRPAISLYDALDLAPTSGFPLVDFTHKGLKLDLADGVLRVASVAADVKFVSPAIDAVMALVKHLRSKLADLPRSQMPDDLAMIAALLDPVHIEQHATVLPAFASELDYALHVNDERNIRSNHGWRLLARLRVLLSLYETDPAAVSPTRVQPDEVVNRLGRLDWFTDDFQPEYTRQQDFVARLLDDKAAGSGAPRSVVITSDWLHLRHFDRLSGQGGVGASFVHVGGVSAALHRSAAGAGAGAARERDGLEQVRGMVGVKSVGVEVLDSILPVIRLALDSAPSSEAEGKSGGQVPLVRKDEHEKGKEVLMALDGHLGSMEIALVAGGLKLRTAVHGVQVAVAHRLSRATGHDGNVAPQSRSERDSVLSTVGKFEMVLLQPDDKGAERVVLLSTLSGVRLVMEVEKDGTDELARVILGVEGFRFESRPQLRAFLVFAREWKERQYPRYSGVIEDIQARLARAPRAESAPGSAPATAPAEGMLPAAATRPCDAARFSVDLSLGSALVHIRAAKAVWIKWDLGKIYVCLVGSPDNVNYGLRLAPQVLGAQATAVGGDLKDGAFLRLPTVALHGSYMRLERSWSADVDFGFFTGIVKPVVLDRLLSLYQRLGQDLRQVIKDYHLEEMFIKRASKAKPQMPVESAPGGKSLFDVRVGVAGVRFGLRADNVATTLLFEALSLRGSAGNRGTDHAALEWHVKAHHLGLSLGQLGKGALTEEAEPTRKYRSAYMHLDVDVRELPASEAVPSQLNIALSKVHTVMHIAALRELGDLISSWTADLRTLGDLRADEVAEVKEQTSKILKRIEVSDRPPELSWFASRLLTVDIVGLGVAVPLDKETALDVRHKSTTPVPAMLFSIRSMSFQNRRNETARFRLQTMMLQFLHQFDQGAVDQFSGEFHKTDNRMSLPHIDAEAQMSNKTDVDEWVLCSHVSATDFQLSLAPSVVDGCFQLVDMYEQGREHVSVLERRYRSEMVKKGVETIAARHERALQEDGVGGGRTPQKIVCRMSFEFQSGVVYLTSAGGASVPMSRRQKEADVVELPKISVWLDYAGPHRGEVGEVVVNFAVHGSQNEIRPTILPFFVQLATRIEKRAAGRKRSTSAAASPVLPSMPPTLKHAKETTSTSESALTTLTKATQAVLRLRATLRIDQSKLRLHDPESQAFVDLQWDSGGFMAATTIGRLENSTFAATINGVTTELSNSNETENSCIKASARDMAVSIDYDPQWRGDQSGLSIVFDTRVSAQFALDKYNSWLTFIAVWVDNAPKLDVPIAAAITESTSNPQNAAAAATAAMGAGVCAEQGIKRKMGVMVLARFGEIDFDAALGVTHAKLQIKPIVLHTLSDGHRTRVDLAIGRTEIAARGKVSGTITSERFRFKTVRKSSRAAGDAEPQLLAMSIDAGSLRTNLFLNARSVARFHLAPSVVELQDDWTDPTVPPLLAFAVRAGRLAGVVRLQAIAQLLESVYDILDVVERQHNTASQRSEAFRTRRLQRSAEPSPIASALMQTMHKAGAGAGAGAGQDGGNVGGGWAGGGGEADHAAFAQTMQFSLAGVDVGVVNDDEPGSGGSSLYRFIVGAIGADLKRVPERKWEREGPFRDLKLELGFVKWDTSDMGRWVAGDDEGPDMTPERILEKSEGMNRKQIAYLPSMKMRMDSNELVEEKKLLYHFTVVWGHDLADIALVPNFYDQSYRAMKRLMDGIERAEKRRWRHLQRIRPGDVKSDRDKDQAKDKDKEANGKTGSDKDKDKTKSKGRAGAEDAQEILGLRFVVRDPETEVSPPLPVIKMLGGATYDAARLIPRFEQGIRDLPKLSHRFVTTSLEEGMDLLLKLYAKQLPDVER